MANPISRRRTGTLSLCAATVLVTVLVTVLATVAATIAGCGGGGSGGGAPAGTELSFSVAWEQPQAARSAQGASDGEELAFDTPIPPAVNAIRFTFRPAGGNDCCIAVLRGSPAFIERRLLLSDVTVGLGSLEVYGFPTNFAPADGVTQLCPTRPGGQGVPCSAGQNTLPSFGSDEIPVDVLQGVRNVVNVDVYSLPFLLDLDPADGETVSNRQPDVDFTVVDANHDIDPDLGIRIQIQSTTVENDILDIEECDDLATTGGVDCSPGGVLEVRGLRVQSLSPQQLPTGQANLRIRASNTANPSRDMESNTIFFIEPDVTTTTDTTTTSTTTSSTTTTLGDPVTYCLKFSVSNAVDLVGISYNVSYGATGGNFEGSGENVDCFSLLDTNPDSTLATFNNIEQSDTLSTAIISTETFSGPVDLAQCRFTQIPPLVLAQMPVQVTEATAPDLSPASATVVVEETQCPLLD